MHLVTYLHPRLPTDSAEEPGFIDRLFYERGLVNRDLPFAELKARSLINEKALAADTDPDFSRRIREGLPPRPPLE